MATDSTDGVDAQITKYEDWAARLEANIEDMAKQRRLSWIYLLAGVLLGGIAWRFHHFFGGALVALGIILWITAIYITWMRTWYYRNELTRTRAEIDTLLASSETPSASKS
jgi:hypothetical protein